MELKIPVRHPEFAYRADWLWLPKTAVNEKVLKNSLTIVLESTRGKQPRIVKLWRDSKHHLGVPRELVKQDQIKCEIIDLTPKFKRVEFKSSAELDLLDPSRSTQRDAYADLIKAPCGILNLACGAGKTVIMLHAVANWGVPTLIINDREHILDQWKDEIKSFLSFQGGIGWIQGKPKTWDWEKPIVLASLKTLAMYADQFPTGMHHHFGTVIWDEVHHLSAPDFSKTAPAFLGNRYGTTATVERGDGTEIVYLSHVGPIIHSNLEQDIQPRVWFANSPTNPDMNTHEVWREVSDVTGELHIGKLSAYIGTLDQELKHIQQHLDHALQSGRNILAISMSKDQVNKLYEMYPQAGIITGDVKAAGSRRAALKHQLTLATAHLAKEALNDRNLDALFILTEFTKEGMLQQATGRVQRMKRGKKRPHVVVISHPHIRPLNAMNKKMRRYFRKQNFEVREI